MGSCISKCKPKNPSKKQHSKQEDQCKCQCMEQNNTTNNTTTLVQDKLVISQAPTSSPTKTSLSYPLSPSITSPSSNLNSSCTKTSYPPTSSSSNSNSSSSSSSCSLLSSASSLASSSSIISSKSDQSFSNDFLWSCVKENPQILHADYLPIKVTNPRRASLPTRCQNSGRKPNGPKELTGPSPQRVVVRSAAQKRPRSNSPSNLTRQKSFRRDAEIEPNRPISRSGRKLRPMSPSSSRRFSGELSNQGRNMTSSMRRDNCYVRPPSPSKSFNSNSRRFHGYGRSNNLLAKREKEDVIKGVSSKIEELTMGDLVSSQNMDLMPIEDANNPHIALDCFIFL